MTNRELEKILNEIERKENLTLSDIAQAANVDRSNLSTFINLEKEKPAGKKVLSKLKIAYPAYFGKSNKSHTENYTLPLGEVKLTLKDYIDVINRQNQFLQELALKNTSAFEGLSKNQKQGTDEILVAIRDLSSSLPASISSALLGSEKVEGDRTQELTQDKSEKNLSGAGK